MITRGWHNAKVPSGPNWTPPPTIKIKKNNNFNPRGNRPRPLHSRLGGPQSGSGIYAEETNLTMPGIEPGPTQLSLLLSWMTWYIEKDLKGSASGLLEILPRVFAGGSGETTKTCRKRR
jgi:hypothetical protein